MGFRPNGERPAGESNSDLELVGSGRGVRGTRRAEGPSAKPNPI